MFFLVTLTFVRMEWCAGPVDGVKLMVTIEKHDGALLKLLEALFE